MAKQPEIKEELGEKASVTEVSKRSAEMWRNLPADERAHWDDVAAKDKQRYMVEKATYTGPWQVPWKRAKKDPSAPKRPMSAFLYFSQDKRRQIKEEHPTIRNTEVSRILGELWRNASEKEKRPHVEKEREEREKYKVAIAEWRKEYEKKMEEQRKQQAEQAEYMNNMYQNGMEQSREAENAQQYPYNDPHGYNPYIHPSCYAYPTQYPPQGYRKCRLYHQKEHAIFFVNFSFLASQYAPSQGQYGYANGKHVAVLGPNGMPHYPPASTYSQPLPHSNQSLPIVDAPVVPAYDPSPYDHSPASPQIGEDQIQAVP